MLRNTLKLIPLALSAAALICLAVVFEGCRSTSSPRDLFFLKIDWTSLMQQRITRSFSLSDQASNLADSAHDALTHASGSLSDLRSKIWSALPDYYAVGLWGYCSGEEGASKYSSCSTPTLSFSFDLVAILESNAPGAASLLPEASKAVLSGLLKSSRLAIAAYIIGMAIATVVACVPVMACQDQRRDSYPDYYDHDQLSLRAWTESNCQGEIAFTTFDNISFARNISNAYVSRSFKLSRPLQGQEQLDISVTREFETWFANKDQLSFNSSLCEHFRQSYFALNGSTDCHNTPDFTCHRLWINPGI